MINAFTVDLEAWFHVCRAEAFLPPETWDRLPTRIDLQTDRLRKLLDRCQVRATFFVLGWVAERHPDLIRALAADGHEIGCHGYAHQRLFELAIPEFREDLARATKLLTEITGRPPVGFRAPEWSVTRETTWALDELGRAGYVYDASYLPSKLCGRPGLRRWPHLLMTSSGRMAEFPATTATVLRQRVPFLSGFSFRAAPLGRILRTVDRINGMGRAVSLAVHPWEFDPEHPRVPMPFWRGLTHYHGLRGTERKVEALLRKFSFAPMREVLARTLPALAPRLLGGQAPAKNF